MLRFLCEEIKNILIRSLVDYVVLPFLDILVRHVSQTGFEHGHSMPRRLLADVTLGDKTEESVSYTPNQYTG